MDYVKFAETIRPLYLLNDWKIAKEPGSSELDYPSVERLAGIAEWAHTTCQQSESDDTYATAARIRVEKSSDSLGQGHSYRFLLDVATEY